MVFSICSLSFFFFFSGDAENFPLVDIGAHRRLHESLVRKKGIERRPKKKKTVNAPRVGRGDIRVPPCYTFYAYDIDISHVRDT